MSKSKKSAKTAKVKNAAASTPVQVPSMAALLVAREKKFAAKKAWQEECRKDLKAIMAVENAESAIYDAVSDLCSTWRNGIYTLPISAKRLKECEDHRVAINDRKKNLLHTMSVLQECMDSTNAEQLNNAQHAYGTACQEAAALENQVASEKRALKKSKGKKAEKALPSVVTAAAPVNMTGGQVQGAPMLSASSEAPAWPYVKADAKSSTAPAKVDRKKEPNKKSVKKASAKKLDAALDTLAIPKKAQKTIKATISPQAKMAFPT